MYSLKEYWSLHALPMPTEDWNGELVCIETDAEFTYGVNETRGHLACFGFTIVIQGNVTLRYSDSEITLNTNDLYCYSPGLEVSVMGVSDNYRAICLLADEKFTLEQPNVRDTIRTALFSVAEINTPCLKLSETESKHLQELMGLAIRYQQSDLPHASASMNMIYGLFLNDLTDIHEHNIRDQRFPNRTIEHFTNFQKLVSRNFVEHHDIAFYASQLGITTTYLSRIVRQVSGGRTVVDYINQLLIMEATFLLRQTSLSIAQIAAQLHYAETTTFTRFFQRIKGMTPKEYRKKRI